MLLCTFAWQPCGSLALFLKLDRRAFRQSTLPPFDVHSLSVLTSLQPKPLHEFCPLQEDDAVLQALVPLHELTPPHFTRVAADASATTAAVANKAAAEAMIRWRLVMSISPTSQHLACSRKDREVRPWREGVTAQSL
jgi:hypothetical protein